MADQEYEQKVKEMQKYIPFLEQLIKKLKANKDDRRESQLNKVQMLYGLLTNKDKKLKLETLQKCETVLVKLCQKIEKTDVLPQSSSIPTTSSINTNDDSSQSNDDIAAPASPSEFDPILENHNPIVIPTERRQTPPPPTVKRSLDSLNDSNYKRYHDDGKLFDRGRNSVGSHSDHRRESGDNNKPSSSRRSPELFRRRSPNRDRNRQYEEELRKKYESLPPFTPTASKYQNQSSYVVPKPRLKTVRNTFTSDVLKSPPLTLDDLKDLMDDSEFKSGPPPVPAPVSAPIPAPVPAPIPPPMVAAAPLPTAAPIPKPAPPPFPPQRVDPRFDHHKDPRFDPRPDPRNFAISNAAPIDQIPPARMDPRNVNRVDPRFKRDMNIPQPVESPKQDYNEPKPVEAPVRLAYKYNPHPRREAPAAKLNEYDQHGQGMSRNEDHRGINHLPSVNPSDPRLRRQLSMMPTGNNCSPHMPSPIGNLPSPMANISSPMSPMANFMDPKLNHAMTDNHNSPNYGSNQQFFGNFQQPASMHMPQNLIHSNPFMSPVANRFKQLPPQPRTYGEYRKFKQSVERTQNKKPIGDAKKDQSNYGMNHSPLETTVKPMDFPTEAAAPNVLDTMYRNTNYKKDGGVGVQGFKIPKIRKEPQDTPKDGQSDDREKASSVSKDKKSTGPGSNKKDHVGSSTDKNQKPTAGAGKASVPSKAKVSQTKSRPEESTASSAEDSDFSGAGSENWDDDDDSDEFIFPKKKEVKQKVVKDSAEAPKDKNKNNDKAHPAPKKTVKTLVNHEEESEAKSKPKLSVEENVSAPSKVVSGKTDSQGKLQKEDVSSTENIIEPSDESKVDEAETPIEPKGKRKRKSDVPKEKVPVKVVKKDTVAKPRKEKEEGAPEEAEPKQSDVNQSTTAPELELETENNEEGSEELPDTIINSDISSKNIIEGKRRTRGSARFDPAFELSPIKPKSTNASPRTSKKSLNKSTEDNSQECAVSSTTTTNDLEPEEPKTTKKATRGRGRPSASAKKAQQHEQEEMAENEKDQAPSEPEATPSASTSNQQKDEITKEWLEGFLLNLFNPAKMSTNSVLTMLEKVLDTAKFQQVKEILCSEDSKPNDEQATTTAEENVTEAAPAASAKDTSKASAKDTSKPKKKKSELDRLNDDIRDMFICQGVLTATGRRMCSAISEKEGEIESEAVVPTPAPAPVAAPKPVNKAVAKPAVKPQTPKTPKRKKTSVFWRGNRRRKKGRGRPRKIAADENIEEEDHEKEDGEEEMTAEQIEEDDEDDMPLSQRKIRKKQEPKVSEGEEEVLKIVVGAGAGIEASSLVKVAEKSEIESDKLLDLPGGSKDEEEAIEKKEVKEEETKADVKCSTKSEADTNAQIEATKTEEDTKQEPEVKLDESDSKIEKDETVAVTNFRRGRGRPPKAKPVSITSKGEFKNDNPDMHSLSEYVSKCVLCPFIGRHMPNHYIHTHPQSEVFISRLPPKSQARLLANEGNKATGSMRKPPNKTLYMYDCPFCEIQNTFTRVGWVDHFGTHTGEYTFKCSECSRMLNFKTEIMKHIQKKCPRAQPIRLRSFVGLAKCVYGYICKKCNYIQMNSQSITEHLQKQHDCSGDDMITKVILLDCTNVPQVDGKARSGSSISQALGERGPKRARLALDVVTDAEQNLEVFVPNEQNDINLDTNIIQFMRDVSFNARGSPPRQSTMSVADRITERLKNASAQSSGNSSENTSNITSPEKPKSMAERLSERFNRLSPQAEQQKPDEPPKNENTSMDISKDNDVEAVAKSQDSDDDVIIISDGEEDAKPEGSTRVESTTTNDSKEQKVFQKQTEEAKTNTVNTIDDDDDWEDIETPPSPSCLETEPKSSTSDNKLKKNKRIYATLSRLYASIVQPQSKNKTEPSNSSTSGTSSNLGKPQDDKVDHKKAEATGMQRINKLGFSRKNEKTLKYHCLVEGCSFLYADIPEGLENHVVFEHPSLIWNGFCHICAKQITNEKDMKLVTELNHMQDVHINKSSVISIPSSTESSSDSVKEVKSRSLLKPITLNKPLSPPPLKIASAVSLNKASDIWKPLGVSSTQETKDKTNLPIVIKQVFSGGSPGILIQSGSNPTSPAMSTLKIAKVMSIADPAAVGDSPTSALTSTPKASIDSSGELQNHLPGKCRLKPWCKTSCTKSEHSIETLLQEKTLCVLFKCMGNDCDFISNTSHKFLNHSSYHFRQRKPDQSWRECCYCSEIAPNAGRLVAHVLKEHENEIYQCAYCFYRSCEEYNVITHQKVYHAGKDKNVIVLFGLKPQKRKEIENVAKSISEFVEPIRCRDCSKRFFCPMEFAGHFSEHISEFKTTYSCFFCKSWYDPVAIKDATSHLEKVHNIARYQCIYCKFGASERDDIDLHMADKHPAKLLFCCIRKGKLDASIEEKVYANTDIGIMIATLDSPVDEQYLHRCPYSEVELNSLGSSATELAAKEKQTPQTTTNAPNQDTEPPPSKVTTDPQVPSQPSTLRIEAVSSLHSSSETLTVPEATESTAGDSGENRETTILNAAADIVRSTGVPIDELFKCGFPDCDVVSTNFRTFRNHLGNSTKHHISDGSYPCYYCEEQFKGVLDCANHYFKHERHRYFCFLCFETGQTAGELVAHITQCHSVKAKSTIGTYALIKGYINAKKDFFFVCPNSVKAADVVRFGDRLLKMWERKKWSQMKKSFTADEIDQLPRQAIFVDELFCAICQYRTKVRTNLYRHLQFHKNEINVANIDPVNPVPCLNSSEKHFDKMTNLACSSHANKPPPPATAGPGTTGGALLSAANLESADSPNARRVARILPDFVPIKSRYTCGVPHCVHTITNQLALRKHLNVVHWNEKSYTCPHCNVVICANKICIDKIFTHLKYHDTDLYQCLSCGYLHFNRSVIQKHLTEHSGENMSYKIIKRWEGGVQTTLAKKTSPLEGSSPTHTGDTSKSNSSGAAMKWQCMLCKTKTSTQGQMSAHILVSHNLKYRYKCSKCTFGGVTIPAISEHAQKRHANAMVEVVCFYIKLTDEDIVQAKTIDTTPLWRRDPNKVRNIRGILMEEEPASSYPVETAPAVETDETLLSAEIEGTQTASAEATKNSVTQLSQVCHICTYVAPNMGDLHSHLAEYHPKEAESKDYLNYLFKFVCYHCKTTHQTMKDYRQHWDWVHKFDPSNSPVDPANAQNEGLAPLFTVLKRLQCLKCGQKNDYRELGIHHFLEHPKEPFATCEVENARRCSHCSFVYESDMAELSKHYEVEHKPAQEESPIPLPPSKPFGQHYLQSLAGLGSALQCFKCNICHIILNDMDACNLHCASQHNITQNAPCTVMQGTIYKCPTCQFCSPAEKTVTNHISNKLKNDNFSVHKSITKPAGISENDWPFAMLEVIFPNGFVVEKFRLLGTHPLGKLDAGEEVGDSPNSTGVIDISEDDDSLTPSQANRRSMKKVTSKRATVDQFDSDEEYLPSGSKKICKPSSTRTSIDSEQKTTSESDKPVEPYSFYGEKRASIDLGSIIANVIIDGVKKVDAAPSCSPKGHPAESTNEGDGASPMEIDESMATSTRQGGKETSQNEDIADEKLTN
ncbi:unnamed protein product [Hermetia illucens]|uniref:C2H2-type domain-containing protein n=1 Tax=Hermetia illucens TaxID=343691 RepID=A0A7R8UTG5_HERIL|nr:unnamed protein product [Hermetia illucens]